MSKSVDEVRRQLSVGDRRVSGSIADTVAASLETEETVEYRMPGSDTLTCEGDTETEEIPVAPGGTAFIIVTDRKLLFAVETPNGGSTVEVPYTDVRNVEADSGLFRSTLRVEVWAEGTYTFNPTGGNLSEAVQFIERVSDCWQRVIGRLEQVQDHATRVEEYLTAGQCEQARKVSGTAAAKIDKAAQVVTQSGDDVEEVLLARIDETRQTLLEARMAGRIERAATLCREAKHQTDATAYGGAYRRYHRAREHLEHALIIDIQQGFGRAADIQSRISDIATRIDHLEVRPMALAKQARERAEGTQKTGVEVSARQEAFEHYRDALTEGWGTDLDFATDESELCSEVEDAVGELIDVRRRYASELAAEADRHRKEGNTEQAADRLTAAREQLQAAEDLARQFRSGDPEALREERLALDVDA